MAISLPEKTRQGEREAISDHRRFYAGVTLAAERFEEFEVTNSGAVRVPSRSRSGFKHTVEVSSSRRFCPCPDHIKGGNVCAHIHAVELLRRAYAAVEDLRGIGDHGKFLKLAHILDFAARVYRPVLPGEGVVEAQQLFYEIRSLHGMPSWLTEAARLRWRAVGEAWSRGRGRAA